MNKQQKQIIRDYILEWLKQGKAYTQAELCRRTGVDGAYMSLIINDKYNDTQPSDGIWQQIQVFFLRDQKHIDSANYRNCVEVFTYAQATKTRAAIDGFSGAGKTYSALRYAKNNPGAYVITGRSSMGQKALLWEVAHAIGVDKYKSMALYELEKEIAKKVERLPDNILLIFDEAEYVKVSALFAIKTLCDLLEHKAGIVLCGIMKEKLEKLAERGKEGMPQVHRRFNMKWQEMYRPKAKEIQQLCHAKGITDTEVIDYIAKRANEYDTLATILDVCTTHRNIDRDGLEKMFGRLPEDQDHNHKRRYRP